MPPTLLILNPNTSPSVTQLLEAAALRDGPPAPGLSPLHDYTELPALGEGRYGGDLVLGPGVATVYARFDAQSSTGQALLRYRAE
jgi:hypothetical protein